MSGVVTPRERLARVALCAITEPGDPRVGRLVAELGAVTVHDRLLDDQDLHGLRSEIAARLAAVEPERVLEGALRRGIRFVVPGDTEWPAPLADLDAVEPLSGLVGAPLGLWLRGPLRLGEAVARAVAVVGSRSATSYGGEVAADLASGLVRSGVTVVSGAAFGIDRHAHRGALGERGPTIAVLACGVDRAYPAAHRDLLELIAAEGLVVSELPPGCAPTRVRFLSRNRLIAALCQGTVVVEAAVRSGALNTASWTGRLNRVLMAVPGPVTSAPSEGANELVRTGAAQLVSRHDHVLELVSPAGEAMPVRPSAPPEARDLLPRLDQRVLEAVPLHQPAAAGAIARTAGLAPAAVRSSLERLVQRGWVVPVGGSWRQRPQTG